MEDELEKLDAIRNRLGVSYEEAERALRESSGDVVSALARLDKGKPSKPDFLGMAAEVASEVKELIGSGEIKRVRIKLGDRIVREVPVALTALGAVAVAAVAVILTKAAIEVDREKTSEGQK